MTGFVCVPLGATRRTRWPSTPARISTWTRRWPTPWTSEGRRSAARPAGWAPLTRREREIAEYVVQGMTNQEIATWLVISKRTADSHIQHILTKLGFTNRAQIAAWVAERGK
jgi:DNA-binding CsgD family transcriptional regulator